MSIFQRKTGYTDYFDRIMIAGWPFDISVRLRDERGDPSAIRCGRIVTFEMYYLDTIIAYFDDGEWLIGTDSLMEEDFDPEFHDAAVMARDMMIQKWSYPERIKMRTEKTELF